MANTEEPPIYEFAGFRLDPTRRLLFAPTGQVLPLQPKVFDTLRYLVVERPGQLLDKNALMKAVWSGVVVEENGLNQHISALRQVFGEKPGENRFIVTVPGRGYVFAAHVCVLGRASSPPAAQFPRHGDSLVVVRRRRVAAGAIASVVGALVVGWVTLRPQEPTRTPAPSLVRLSLELGPGQHLSGGVAAEEVPYFLGRPSRRSFALSPDGDSLVYAATDGTERRLYLRPMYRREAVPLTGTDGASQPFFSPDGENIGFLVGNVLKRIATSGGESRTITELDEPVDALGITASWTENDTILVSTAAGILEMNAAGGERRQLTKGGGTSTGRAHLYPQRLPGNRGLLFNVADGVVPSDWDIVVSTPDGSITKLIDGGSDPRYLRSGQIVFARGGGLWAVGFDLDRLQVIGSEMRVVEDVMHAERAAGLDLNFGAAQFSVSNTGTLAIVGGGPYPKYEFSLAWLGQDGNIERVQLDSALFSFPRVSPAGNRLAYSTGGFGESQVWTFDSGSGVPLRLTEGGHNVAPIWSPDGKRLAFARVALDGAGDAGIYTFPADGSEEPKRIAAGHFPVTSSWSAANVIAYVDGESEPQESIWTVRADGTGEARRFLPDGEVGAYPDFSPDGRWIAYAALEENEFIVYVRPFPEGAPRIRISPRSGYAPMWSRDGRQLFYVAPEAVDGSPPHALMVVDIEENAPLRASKPRRIGPVPWGRTHPARPYDSAADGRFVFPSIPAPLPPEPVVKIEIVQNWGDELRQLKRSD